MAQSWRKWLDAHGGETREQWEQRALALAQERIASGTREGASKALVTVLRDRVTRARARALVPSYRQRFGELSYEVKAALK